MANTYVKPKIFQQSPTDSNTTNNAGLPSLSPPNYDESSGSGTAVGFHIPPPAYPTQSDGAGRGPGFENAINNSSPGGFGPPGQAPHRGAPPAYTYGAAVASVGAGQHMIGEPYIATQQPMPAGPVVFCPMERSNAVVVMDTGPAPSKVTPSPTTVIGVTIFRAHKLRASILSASTLRQVHTPRNPISAQSIPTLLHGFLRVMRVMSVIRFIRVNIA